MSTTENIIAQFHQKQNAESKKLRAVERNAFEAFEKNGIPTVKNEEWKYTRVGGLFNKEFDFSFEKKSNSLTAKELEDLRLPGHEEANELVFVNGIFSSDLSNIRSSDLIVQSLVEASSNEYGEIVSKYLGQSSRYVKDGVHALNTAFVREGIFVCIKKSKEKVLPVYIYHITDARSGNTYSQPRTLIYVSAQVEIEFAETYVTIGGSESFTNQVTEVVVEEHAIVDYYKIQNDSALASQVNTSYFLQTAKSVVKAVTISLNGHLVRNNLIVGMDAAYSEAHLYGLYFLKGSSHIDNHTVVDNIKPNCESNELYKGIIDDQGTAVFNGKIFVQQIAQKTNAFQSNKNILLSDTASVNTKPQLEIFADDVKCSHGCTVGQLDEEGMFYLRSRGINEDTARALLVHAFAIDILEHIKPLHLRNYIDRLISDRLEFDIS